MTARMLLAPLFALSLGLLVAACGDGDGGELQPARLTDPRTVPTATAWPEPPDAIPLEPDVLTPTSPDEGEEDGDGADSIQVTPVTSFQVTSGDSTNRRDSPSTDGAVVGTIDKDNTATVTGQVTGEAVVEGNDIWYQLDDGSFVYSGAVTKVEE